MVSESSDPIDFIFAEEIENIKGAILSSARAAGGTHGVEEGKRGRGRRREGAQPTSSMITGGREGAVVRVGATFSVLPFQ